MSKYYHCNVYITINNNYCIVGVVDLFYLVVCDIKKITKNVITLHLVTYSQMEQLVVLLKDTNDTI